MDPDSWAAHPNADLRRAIADYVTLGWEVESLGEGTAVVRMRRKLSVGKYALMGPWHLWGHVFGSDERRLLTARTGFIDDRKLSG